MTIVNREVRALRAAIAYFTRIPISGAIEPDDLRAAPRYFPLVGAGVGVFGAAAWWLTGKVLPNDVSVVVTVAATILLTGAMHEDGFADVCDGFGGGYDQARILAIMKDSHIGAFGVIGIALLLGLKVLMLGHVPAALMFGTLVSAHAASRWAAGTLLVTHAYVREEAGAKAKAMSGPVSWAQMVVPTLCGIAPTLSLLPTRYGVALLAVVLVRFVLGRWFLRRIGGYTGDCVGATQQVGEVAFYLVVVAIPCP